MNVREVMTTTIIAVQEETSFKATAQAMLTNRVSCLPVMDSDGHLVGIVSESDLLPKESQDGGLFGTASEVAETPKEWDLFAKTRKSLALTARDLMSQPVQTTGPDVALHEVARRMASGNIRHLPVVEDGALVGMLTAHDVIKVFVSPDAWTQIAVEEALRAHGFALPDHDVEVVVDQGVVTLRGVTANSGALLQILGVVRAVDGVVAIHEHLSIDFPATSPT